MDQQIAGPARLGVVTPAASDERNRLRRSVGRLDAAFLMLAAIIVLDTPGAVSSNGAQAFTGLRARQQQQAE